MVLAWRGRRVDAEPRVHTTRAEVIQNRRSFSGFLKMWDGGRFPEICRRRGPISLGANSRGARSLGLAQRIVFGFVQTLDFAAVEALIPNLQPRAEGFWRP